jgi:hypothetical protein
VPPGDALGNGVAVAVGRGEVCKGVTVAVGRGPGGMLALGSGVIDSLGDCASAAKAIVMISTSANGSFSNFVIAEAS